jgi:hypothetical protein
LEEKRERTTKASEEKSEMAMKEARMRHASISAAGNVTILIKMVIIFTIVTKKNWVCI